MNACEQTSLEQVSAVQTLLSSGQSVSVLQDTQPGIGAYAQTPLEQVSAVQASLSPQSAAVVQGTQPGLGSCEQTLPPLELEQVSVVHALLSLAQSAALAHWEQPPSVALARRSKVAVGPRALVARTDAV